MDGRPPGARGRDPSAGREGAAHVGAHLARVGSGRGENAHRPLRPPAIFGAEAGAPALLRRRPLWPAARLRGRTAGRGIGPGRSEEHTSELQSLMRISYAVFCLKKKTKTKMNTDNH